MSTETIEMSLDALTLGVGNTLFISERRRPLERSNVCKMVNTFAKVAGLSELHVHPHMLRHSCWYDLANRGVDTLHSSLSRAFMRGGAGVNISIGARAMAGSIGA